MYHCVCRFVVFGVRLWLLVINTSSLSPVKNKRRRLPATSVINLPRSVAAACIALGGQTVHGTRSSQILAENRGFCLPHLHWTPPSAYCHNVWYRKTGMVCRAYYVGGEGGKLPPHGGWGGIFLHSGGILLRL